MPKQFPFIVATASLLLLLGIAPGAQAQDERALKSYFEGRRVVMRLDMPGSSEGVDLRMDNGGAIDFPSYRNDIKRYGIALRADDPTMVTLVRVKKDLIEFQLGGGGFGTFGDDTSTSSGIHYIDKSEREKDLERRLKNEVDRDRRRQMQRELDDLRDRRERENRRLRAESERIEEIKRERIAQDRLHGGSRFNLRWRNRVPETIRPEDIVAALTEYIDFRQADDRRGPAPAPASSADISTLRKGMSRDEVERNLGRAVQRNEKRDGSVVVTTLTFDVGEQRVLADFVEDILVRYTISSR